jgi:hypothetical protein
MAEQPTKRQVISGWNVSCVTIMNDMFTEAKAFKPTSLDGTSRVLPICSLCSKRRLSSTLTSIHVSKVTNMFGMFASAPAFNQDISEWDVSMVTEITLTSLDGTYPVLSKCKAYSLRRLPSIRIFALGGVSCPSRFLYLILVMRLETATVLPETTPTLKARLLGPFASYARLHRAHRQAHHRT